MYKLDLKKAEEPEVKLLDLKKAEEPEVKLPNQTPLDHRKSKVVLIPEKHLLLLHGLH